MAYQQNSRSPPPLLHPVPTHPTYVPELPPSTPASPQGYQRFASTSSPPPPQQGYFAQNQNNRPPYASHFSPPHQPQPLHQQQQHQGYPAPGGNIGPNPGHNAQIPDFSAWGLDGATTQLGMQLGQSAVQAGQNYVQQNVRVLRTNDHAI
jgi:hypothetical protein